MTERLRTLDEAENFVILEGTIAARKRLVQCHSELLTFITSHEYSNGAVDGLMPYITEELVLTYVLPFYEGQP